VTFDPQDRSMARARGQVMYRYRPQQTFDHVGGYVAQVRQYGRDDAYQGPIIDKEYLVDEAMRLVRRWRAEGRLAGGAAPGSDRAPEFPQDGGVAHQHYEIVIPGKVFCQVWPRVVRCASCGLVWDAPDPRPGVDDWPPRCPRPQCGNLAGNRQLQFAFVHQCGEVRAMRPPRECRSCHGNQFSLNDRASRFMDFRWECLRCGQAAPVQDFCRQTCPWTEKRMAPMVHTASSAYVGHGVTLVMPPTEDFARLARTPPFVVATIGRWLGECSEDEADRVLRGTGTPAGDPEILETIQELEATGDPDLVARAEKLRRRFFPLDLDELGRRVEKVLGYDPLTDDRGPALAHNLAVYQQALGLSRLTLDDLDRQAASAGRAARYVTYRPTLRRAGLAPDATAVAGDFPITYLAYGYSRAGWGPREADLVAYKGRADRGQQISTLLYANPTETEALVFALDTDRVERWLTGNGLVDEQELRAAGGVKRWFASKLDPHDGQRPQWDPDHEPLPGEPDHAPLSVFRLLHSCAHQLLRALAVDSGFSETALSEYLFPYELAFAIHPNGGSEFTIGGLRTVVEQNLDEVVNRAVDNATCLYDPNCMEANRGVDHGCLHLPETACQSWNRFLSRWELFGSPFGELRGYWSPEFDES
jgi:hypothetical protein